LEKCYDNRYIFSGFLLKRKTWKKEKKLKTKRRKIVFSVKRCGLYFYLRD